MVKTWTLRDVAKLFSDPLSAYKTEDFYAFFHTILNMPNANLFDEDWKSQLVSSGENRLELWQINARFDLVYYHLEKYENKMQFVRKLRVNIRKPQIYIPETPIGNDFPIKMAKLSPYPLIKDEYYSSFISLCQCLCEILDKIRK
jgi:hypothetical protein